MFLLLFSFRKTTILLRSTSYSIANPIFAVYPLPRSITPPRSPFTDAPGSFPPDSTPSVPTSIILIRLPISKNIHGSSRLPLQSSPKPKVLHFSSGKFSFSSYPRPPFFFINKCGSTFSSIFILWAGPSLTTSLPCSLSFFWLSYTLPSNVNAPPVKLANGPKATPGRIRAVGGIGSSRYRRTQETEWWKY